jgi:hypothetical protein
MTLIEWLSLGLTIARGLDSRRARDRAAALHLWPDARQIGGGFGDQGYAFQLDPNAHLENWLP